MMRGGVGAGIGRKGEGERVCSYRSGKQSLCVCISKESQKIQNFVHMCKTVVEQMWTAF